MAGLNKLQLGVFGRKTSASSFDFTSNLIAYYPFNGNANDLSGNGHNGNFLNPVYGTGQIGQAAGEFLSTAYVTVPDNNDFSFTDGVADLPFTIITAVKFNDISGTQFLVSKRDNGSNREWQIAVIGTQLSVFIGTNNYSAYINATATGVLTTGVWFYLIARYDGSGTASGLRLSLNNSISVTGTMTGTYTGMVNGNRNVYIGTTEISLAFRTRGLIDETYIYKNRMLTDDECTEAYSRFSAGIPLI